MAFFQACQKTITLFTMLKRLLIAPIKSN